MEARRPVVAQPSAAGMSTRAIAPVVGVTQSTVDRDVQVTRSGSPAPAEGRIPDATPARTFTDEPGTVQRITGMDGKRYTRPEPVEPP